MRTTLKRIISCLIVICLTVAILAGLTSITENKSSLHKYAQFFSQEADFDVLFIGSSTVINGILPVELWNDYGIVSYNMGGHANTIPTSYWVLRNALDYTTPKCVVIDCKGSGGNGLISSQFDYAHLSFDSFPLTPTKVRAVFDLVDPEEWSDSQTRRMELLWNFSIYHSCWNTISITDFHPNFSYQKGAELRPNVSIPAEYVTGSVEGRNTWDTLGMEYIIKSIELCKERGIDVILIHLPYPGSNGDLIAANTVGDVAKAYGVEYLNFLNMDIVDYQTDMYDPTPHLNPSGAFKVTDYLGQVLSEGYAIPDQRNNPDYAAWYEDARKYQQEKIELFENANSAWTYWMLLSDNDFSFIADISQKDLQQDDVLTALLRNAGIQPEKVLDRTIIAANRNTGAVTYTEYETLLQGSVETALGTLTLEDNCVSLDSQSCWQITAGSEDMHFVLLDAPDQFLGTACFSPAEIRPPQHIAE